MPVDELLIDFMLWLISKDLNKISIEDLTANDRGGDTYTTVRFK